ncbi:MAG TPA: hypothetical protein VMF59_02765 [Bacteroidota bacterium]|nr:hypothetical protein [Bacteroidota bacterium]
MMKSLALCVAALLSLFAGRGGTGVSEKTDIQKSIQFPAGSTSRRIVVDNLSGSIHVVGYDGAEVQLLVHRTSYGDSQEKLAESRAKITLDIREEPGTIVLYVNTPWRCKDGSVSYRLRQDYGYDAEMDFDLKVPRSCDFALKTVNKGAITVSNMAGAFEVDNVNGGIEMEEIAGAGLVSTVNGNVGVRFASNPDTLCAFRTVNGSIEIQVPGELSADLRLKTFNGEVFSDFNVTGLPRRLPASERVGRRTVYRGDEYFSVRAGGGGPLMQMETLNGDIRILRSHK